MGYVQILKLIEVKFEYFNNRIIAANQIVEYLLHLLIISKFTSQIAM